MCCNDSEDCVKIPDVGYGDVGCCVKGDSCSGNLSGCGAGKISCDIKIGGGCCNEGTLCSPSGCIDVGEEMEAAPPATAPLTGSPNTECPVGFSKCGDEVGGGCCREGRSCQSTACPAADQPATVVAPAPQEAVCAAGWKSCDNYEGGGCCPEGYSCGVRNCPKQTVAVMNVVGGLLMQATTTLGEVGKLPQETGEAGENVVKRGFVAMAVAVAVVGVV